MIRLSEEERLEERQEVRLEERLEIARNLMKKNINLNTISEATGLSEDQLKTLL